MTALIERHIPPPQCHRHHETPPWKSDTPAALKRESMRRVGKGRRKFADINFRCCKDDVMALHNPTARLCGYLFIVIGHVKHGPRKGKEIRRKMTRAELDRPLEDWTGEQIKRWRRTKGQGSSWVSNLRPYSWREMLRWGKKFGVVICAELKSRAFATQAKWAKFMVDIMHEEKTIAYFMTLVFMWGWGEKMKNFYLAGGGTALLAHDHKKPKEFAQYDKYIDRVWGKFR